MDKIKIGQIFGDLTVISYKGLTTHRTKNYGTWFCNCQCGNTSIVTTSRLKSGKTKSCGCRRKYAKSIYKGYEQISGTYWKRVQADAASRNFVFDIKIEDAWTMFLDQNRKCKLSGLDINFARNYTNTKIQTASFDRIDSSKGYTKDNVQWLHKDINKIKFDLNQNYFIELCQLVTNNSIK